MANILTTDEAANVLRCETDDPVMLILLGIIDAHINDLTNRDWTLDHPINPIARDAAITLLIRRHEDPGGMGQLPATVDDHFRQCILQLKMLALEEQL